MREHLEDNPENYTRFLLLSPPTASVENANKLSLVFELSRTPGALFHALSPFASRGLNLMKIESRPVHGSPWQYRFYLDLQASRTDPAQWLRRWSRCRAWLSAGDLRVLGSYPSAEWNWNSKTKS